MDIVKKSNILSEIQTHSTATTTIPKERWGVFCVYSSAYTLKSIYNVSRDCVSNVALIIMFLFSGTVGIYLLIKTIPYFYYALAMEL